MAATALVGLAVALGYVLLAPTTVTAAAVVAVRPVVTDAFTPTGASADRSVNMNVESGIATSTEVIQIIARDRGAAPVDVRDALQIEVPTGGQILRFSYTAPSVDVAVATVNLAADTYLKVRKSMYEKQRTSMLQSYDASIAKVVQQQQSLQRRIAAANGTGSEAAALAELGAVNTQLAQLNSARTEIASIDVTPGWVTQFAEPLTTSTDDRALYVLAGALGGLLLGIVFAYVRESTERVVRTAADAHDAAGLPLLGAVRSRGFRTRSKAVDADVRYVAMAIAERFTHAVRTPVVVIASRAREDTTLMTASLAVALAADGKDVYVGDDSGRVAQLRAVLMADQRPTPAAPAPPRQLGASGSAGERPGPAGPDAGSPDGDADATVRLPRITPAVAEQFLATSTADGVVTTTMAEVPVRTVSPEVLKVGTGRVRVGPYQGAPETEIVLFNAPPAELDERGVGEARRGTAIVVVERNRTRVTDLRRLVERLRAAGAEPLGYVFTRSGRG
ncbi:hypothetical protein SAMN05444365_10332 [Micromonospora pattaloongensis]|uniref:Capsular polysaccharide biosynthesis protein n=1 Tax=Micromonospora pattaloongensis TaxID=405436 RepID=A0A1H3LPG1_9ACTN|nr:hypothetical protein SAMN05444365_10332 [Micromonospora pattaloongensis]